MNQIYRYEAYDLVTDISIHHDFGPHEVSYVQDVHLKLPAICKQKESCVDSYLQQ
jgi:hypothetical protein